ncbi:MAG: hypothetical protein NTX36_11420 [Proteobacteria bacterium]|nr:hypothetical protein [Pseudomonadota bacterium]
MESKETGVRGQGSKSVKANFTTDRTTENVTFIKFMIVRQDGK